MYRTVTVLLGLALIIICNSCAATYRPITPEKLNYGFSEEADGVRFSYAANVLQTSGNKKYVKKESRSDVSVIAVKITNTSSESITFSEDVFLSSGLTTYDLLSPAEITATVKQSAASYILFLLLTPMKLYIGESSGEVTEYSIGYVVGPGLALGNMAMASSANANFKKELADYSLLNKEIESGETVYGLVGIRNFGYGNLHLKKID